MKTPHVDARPRTRQAPGARSAARPADRSKALRLAALVGLAVALVVPSRASAVFHLMQIEQVVAGVCGDSTIQAVQLRSRFAGQNEVTGTRLVAYDAAGANPVVILTFDDDVGNGAAGARILVVSSAFGSLFPPTADFTLTSLIPSSYLPAGRLTFEDSTGEIFWSLAWGGSAYTGSTTGEPDNDDDGDFGPPFGGPLPSSGSQALLFDGDFGDESTTNADDYVLSGAGALFTNNSGASGSIAGCVFGDGFESGGTSLWSSAVP